VSPSDPMILVAFATGGGLVLLALWWAESRRFARRAAEDEKWCMEQRAADSQVVNTSRAVLMGAVAGSRAWDRATAVREKLFDDGWLGPEADDAAFLRSLGIEP
jgi:hypothetical protein